MAESDVSTPCAAYRDMAKRWELIDDLLGGTLTMRERGTKWLPREPREQVGDYQIRLDRSTLYGALSDTIEMLTAKPYSKPITIAGDLPAELEPLLTDADLAGQSLQQLGRSSFSSGIAAGLDHFLIDMPQGAEGATRLDQKTGRVRPAIIHVPAKAVIGWRAMRVPGGGYKLTQVRIKECVSATKGEYDSEDQEQILVLDAPESAGGRGTWRRFRKSTGADWTVDTNGTFTYPGIPLVTWYTKRQGFLVGMPPLEDLAWLNLRHWQSYSDQANILRFSRFSQLAKTGITKDEYENPRSDSGPNRELLSTNPDAKFYIVEPSGAAIKSGFDDLRTLEERMEVLGQQPLIERMGDATATGVRANQGKTMTTIQSWIRNQEIALEAAFRIAAEMQGAELPEDFGVDIFSDFTAAAGDPAQAQLIVQMRQAGDIDQETELLELQRRDVLAADRDVDEIIRKTKEEGPSLAQIGAQMRIAGGGPPQQGDPSNGDPANKPDDMMDGAKPPKPAPAAA